jgi:serine/threonine-protein kinase
MHTTTLGRYRIIREIARSNDVVYEAVDAALNRRVALKELVVPPNLSPEQRKNRVDRFYREARAAGSLAHPNIVSIFEAGEVDGRHFIAMEYLEGRSLRKVIEEEGQISPERAVEIACKICNALGYAHSKSVVHRDIKPDNIQVLPSGEIKITDFGIARIMEEPTLTADGQVFGTPSYMSPEQVAGKDLDCRTDLFSLGVVLFEMLTGRKPFAGDTVVTITYNIMNQEVTVPPTIPFHLERVIKRSLMKDPNLRYGSAAEMAADLVSQDTGRYGFFSPPQPADDMTQLLGPIFSPPPPAPPQRPVSADPFAGMKPGYLSMPRVPSQPIISEDAWYFIKVMMTVVFICGIVISFAWALNTAYQGYSDRARQGKIDQVVRKADDYIKQQSYQSAASEYELAAKMYNDPRKQADMRHNEAECYIAVGDPYFNAGDYDQARIWWQKASDVDPDGTDTKDRSARLLLQQGDDAQHAGNIQSAIDFWTKAMHAAPGTDAGQLAMQRLQPYATRINLGE